MDPLILASFYVALPPLWGSCFSPFSLLFLALLSSPLLFSLSSSSHFHMLLPLLRTHIRMSLGRKWVRGKNERKNPRMGQKANSTLCICIGNCAYEQLSVFNDNCFKTTLFFWVANSTSASTFFFPLQLSLSEKRKCNLNIQGGYK